MSDSPKHPRRAAEPLLRMEDGKPARMVLIYPKAAQQFGIRGWENSLNLMIAPAGKTFDFSKVRRIGVFSLN